jgi:hypothetical protein
MNNKYNFSDPEIVDAMREFLIGRKKSYEKHGLIPTLELLIDDLKPLTPPNEPHSPEDDEELIKPNQISDQEREKLENPKEHDEAIKHLHSCSLDHPCKECEAKAEKSDDIDDE